MSNTIYVAIGNSDDRLTQREWAAFHDLVDREFRHYEADVDGITVHGRWASLPTAPHQNACWAFSVDTSVCTIWEGEGGMREYLRESLSEFARRYRQHSIAWSEAPVEFLPGITEEER